MYRYELIVYWSQEDGAYFVEVATSLGRTAPEPRGRTLAFA